MKEGIKDPPVDTCLCQYNGGVLPAFAPSSSSPPPRILWPVASNPFSFDPLTHDAQRQRVEGERANENKCRLSTFCRFPPSIKQTTEEEEAVELLAGWVKGSGVGLRWLTQHSRGGRRLIKGTFPLSSRGFCKECFTEFLILSLSRVTTDDDRGGVFSCVVSFISWWVLITKDEEAEEEEEFNRNASCGD